MQEIIKSKLILYFAIFGAAFSLILGLATGVYILTLLLRVLISAVAMAAVAVGVVFLMKKFIPEKDLNELLGKKTGGEEYEDQPQSPERRVDITDDDTMTAEDMYRASDGYTPPVSDNPDYRYDAETPPEEGSDDEPDEFKETNFSDSPKVKVFDMGGEGVEQDIVAEAPTDEKEEMIRNELDRLKERAKTNEPAPDIKSTSDGSFKVGKTKVTADPKIIAKAIRTVLHRD